MKISMDLIKFQDSNQKVKIIILFIDKIDSLYVKDINDYLLHKTTRISNPLEPTYEHYDEKG